jgi:hypothetical protein
MVVNTLPDDKGSSHTNMDGSTGPGVGNGVEAPFTLLMRVTVALKPGAGTSPSEINTTDIEDSEERTENGPPAEVPEARRSRLEGHVAVPSNMPWLGPSHTVKISISGSVSKLLKVRSMTVPDMAACKRHMHTVSFG